MNIDELIQIDNLIQTINYKKIDVKGIEINLNGELKNKLAVIFDNSMKKYGVTFEDLKRKDVGALLTEKVLNTDIPQIVVKDIRLAYSQCSQNYYGNPSKKLKLIFVTGTNGKTTTTFFIKSIFEHANIKIGIIGTLGCEFGEKSWPTGMTTPDPHVLNKILSEMLELGAEVVVMEASAHAIYLKKLDGLTAQACVLTNCKRDHLDFFQTEQGYRTAKRALFCGEFGKVNILNLDDSLGEEIFSANEVTSVSYAIGCEADICAKNLRLSGDTKFTLSIFNNCKTIHTSVLGKFNVYNILSAVATAKVFGISDDIIFEAVEDLRTVGGRFEKIENDLKCNIIIDFAHTPDSLENILISARAITFGKLVCVFGCGGDRDRGKREIMGMISARYSDLTIITSDNPRTEEPLAIIEEIERGVRREKGDYVVLSGRPNAIEYAIKNAKEGDTIIIAGKGCEDYIEIDNQKYPYSDYDEVKKQLEQKRG